MAVPRPSAGRGCRASKLDGKSSRGSRHHAHRRRHAVLRAVDVHARAPTRPEGSRSSAAAPGAAEGMSGGPDAFTDGLTAMVAEEKERLKERARRRARARRGRRPTRPTVALDEVRFEVAELRGRLDEIDGHARDRRRASSTRRRGALTAVSARSRQITRGAGASTALAGAWHARLGLAPAPSAARRSRASGGARSRSSARRSSSSARSSRCGPTSSARARRRDGAPAGPVAAAAVPPTSGAVIEREFGRAPDAALRDLRRHAARVGVDRAGARRDARAATYRPVWGEDAARGRRRRREGRPPRRGRCDPRRHRRGAAARRAAWRGSACCAASTSTRCSTSSPRRCAASSTCASRGASPTASRSTSATTPRSWCRASCGRAHGRAGAHDGAHVRLAALRAGRGGLAGVDATASRCTARPRSCAR